MFTLLKLLLLLASIPVSIGLILFGWQYAVSHQLWPLQCDTFSDTRVHAACELLVSSGVLDRAAATISTTIIPALPDDLKQPRQFLERIVPKP